MFAEGYEYVLLSRLQSDPLEKQFGKYRQMSGGRFLVSLREVQNSENILTVKPLIKAGINTWDERLVCSKHMENRNENLLQQLQLLSNDIQENVLCEDSREVAIYIAGYITKKMLKKSKCSHCNEFLKTKQVSSEYVDILSRGGLKNPSKSLADFVCAAFAILDTAKDLLYHYPA